MWATALTTRMFDMAGQSVDKENQKLLVRELMRDLETRYRLLAMEEVETIIGNGVRGDYGDYYGLNIASISKWFKIYLDSGAHNEYLASKVKELKMMLPEKTGLTDGEVEDIFKSGCIRCFNEYTKGGACPKTVMIVKVLCRSSKNSCRWTIKMQMCRILHNTMPWPIFLKAW